MQNERKAKPILNCSVIFKYCTSLAFLDSLVHGGRTESPTMTASDVLLKD